MLPANLSDLQRCEEGIARTQNQAKEFFAFVSEIREKELWRANSDYKSLEDYGQKRWQWSRQRIHQVADAGALLLALPPSLSTMVDNERQTRALGAMPVEAQKEVLTKLKESGKPVTAKAIKKVAQELSEEEQAKQDALSYLSHQAKGDLPSIPDQVPDSPVVDCMGFPIPKGIVAYYERARTEFRELMNALSKVKCQIEKAQAAEDPLYLMLGQTLAGDINSIRWNIKRKLPHTVCTQCNGYPLVNGSCELCSSTGFNFEEEQTSNPWIGDVLKIRAAGIAKKQQNA